MDEGEDLDIFDFVLLHVGQQSLVSDESLAAARTQGQSTAKPKKVAKTAGKRRHAKFSFDTDVSPSVSRARTLVPEPRRRRQPT